MFIFRRTIVLTQHLVSSLTLGDCSVHRLREDSHNLCTEQSPKESDDTRCCVNTIDFLKKRIILDYLLNYLLTYLLHGAKTSREANWFAASQEIARISRNPNVQYRTHNRPPPLSLSPPLPLSLSIYIYICIHTHTHTHTHIEGKVIPLQARCGPKGG